jgi:Nuclease-related domain
MSFGVGATAWIWLRESPPGYIETWQTGAEGERKTEKALRRLETSGWTVVHDIDAGRGNYDHIAVSGAGVFVRVFSPFGGESAR